VRFTGIRPVGSKKDVKKFITLPWKIYSSDPLWVPPLLRDRKKIIDRKKNPFYSHADAEFFLAYQTGEIVGRIAAIINHNHNKEHKENIGFFGFFELGQNISDRLAFVEILNAENNFSKSTFDLYKMFKIDPSEIIQLDDYFLEYFIRLLKRLRDINFEDVQKQKNLII